MSEYQPQPLIAASNGAWIDDRFHHHEFRYRITASGRDYYKREWQHYRALYPEVDAPESVT